MHRKAILGVLTMLLVGVSTFAFNIRLPRASGTIYIRPDGSVDPPDGRIITEDLVHYYFAVDISDSIVVERDNIVLDGAGCVIQGLGQTSGVLLQNRVNVAIIDMEIEGFESGIQLSGSSNCYIYNNTVTASDDYGLWFSNSNGNRISDNNLIANGNIGIYLGVSSSNTLSGNTVTNNGDDGIYLWHSSNDNTLSGNTVTNNGGHGIELSYSSNNNTLSGNSITNNSRCIRLGDSSNNNTLSGNTVTNNGYYGIELSHSSNNTLSGNSITNNWHGIYLGDSSNNTLSGNNITNNGFYGIFLSDSSNNTLSGNSVTNNDDHGIVLLDSSNNNTLSGNSVTNNDDDGIYLSDSSNNTLSGNTIAYNGVGIFEGTSSNSFVYHNNFLNNEVQTVQYASRNFWDNGPLERGNYWSDYEGIDQNGDGIGDTSTPHHKDRYPFIVPVGPIPFFWKEVRYDCSFLGNATVSMPDFDHPSKSISFDISLANTTGYCNVTVPMQLLKGIFKVLAVDTHIAHMPSWNETHTSIYFEVPVPPFGENTTYKVRVVADVATPLTGDINNDGFVDIFDVVLVAKHFGEQS